MCAGQEVLHGLWASVRGTPTVLGRVWCLRKGQSKAEGLKVDTPWLGLNAGNHSRVLSVCQFCLYYRLACRTGGACMKGRVQQQQVGHESFRRKGTGLVAVPRVSGRM